MTRRDRILKHVSRSQRGIEIGPWFNALAPKREGYNCLSMDVYDTATLRSRATADATISVDQAALIEDVDIVGSSVEIGELIRARGEAGAFDYVVSSHNFEHLPNPIRFLNGCANVLRSSGMLSMAIPDHRWCFDYFRPITRLSDWIQSFHDNRQQPSLAQVFEGRLAFAHYVEERQKRIDFAPSVPASAVACDIDLADEWRSWASRVREQGGIHSEVEHGYMDAHCSVFTPASFELLLRDCGYLGLTSFVVAEVVSEGFEFHAHLQLAEKASDLRPAHYPSIRTELLQRIRDEEAENSQAYQRVRAELSVVREELRQVRSPLGPVAPRDDQHEAAP